jgi:hypothetical protein
MMCLLAGIMANRIEDDQLHVVTSRYTRGRYPINALGHGSDVSEILVCKLHIVHEVHSCLIFLHTA